MPAPHSWVRGRRSAPVYTVRQLRAAYTRASPGAGMLALRAAGAMPRTSSSGVYRGGKPLAMTDLSLPCSWAPTAVLRQAQDEREHAGIDSPASVVRSSPRSLSHNNLVTERWFDGALMRLPNGSPRTNLNFANVRPHRVEGRAAWVFEGF